VVIIISRPASLKTASWQTLSTSLFVHYNTAPREHRRIVSSWLACEKPKNLIIGILMDCGSLLIRVAHVYGMSCFFNVNTFV
jgi:hypothetical protein